MNWSSIVDWKNFRIHDLSQPTSWKAPPFMWYPPMKVHFIKFLGENRVRAQYIESSMHHGTHLDGQMHFMTAGKDIASLPIEHYLVDEGLVLDIGPYVDDYDVYTPELVKKAAREGNVQIKKGDILILRTGYHHYAWCGDKADEVRYMIKHPGPTAVFAKWCIEMKFKWLAVDAASQDHPFNTVIRNARPDLVEEAEKKWGKKVQRVLPWPENYQVMHIMLFPHLIQHAENLGGEIDEAANKRGIIGCFPFKFEDGETAFARIVAFMSE
jgi:arylformamidase